MNDKVINYDVLTSPIGTKIKIPDDVTITDVVPIYKDIKIELYCPECKEKRIFTSNTYKKVGFYLERYDISKELLEKAVKEHLLYIFKCELKHQVTLILEIESKNILIKIGQYPSSISLQISANNELLKELDKDNKKYYLNALKAYNDNLNIAAFIYLRRIFESLINEACKKSSQDYKGMKIKEIIKDLVNKNLINPLFIDTGYNILYSLISDGVHNLSEEKCKEQFILLKDAIEIILEDEIYKKKQEKRKKSIGNKLSNMNSAKETINE